MAEWLYRVLRPLTAYIELTPADSDSDHYVMLFSVTPVSENESIGWMWNSMDYNHEMSDEDFLAYVDEIVFQDIPIIESQRPELLPVDLQADIHVKADATSIAYRRWLKELGLSTGTL
jgi:phenylpropionate dioxygenase-like ring-hydroxylating dioxygenase large terminal subunit